MAVVVVVRWEVGQVRRRPRKVLGSGSALA